MEYHSLQPNARRLLQLITSYGDAGCNLTNLQLALNIGSEGRRVSIALKELRDKDLIYSKGVTHTRRLFAKTSK